MFWSPRSEPALCWRGGQSARVGIEGRAVPAQISIANAATMEPWRLSSVADVGEPDTSASGMTCPGGQYEDSSGDCHACTFSAPVLWAILVLCGLIVCGVAWWLGNVALQRIATAQGASTSPSVGQVVAHGERGAMQVRHATTTFSSSTTSFQFLYLFQVHLTWPAVVTEAWRWITEVASLAWFRLEFLFDTMKSLCTKQHVPPAATLLAPFIMFSIIYCISRTKANEDEKVEKLDSSSRTHKKFQQIETNDICLSPACI